ncbi:hypothetical protein R1flu_020239 [Riccia fluitans]|uniref:Uncharacterized protein n=1 Tax=Riccia fluitans TaxID=41844 RepID=A0ABD1ZKX9_9MARC
MISELSCLKRSILINIKQLYNAKDYHAEEQDMKIDALQAILRDKIQVAVGLARWQSESSAAWQGDLDDEEEEEEKEDKCEKSSLKIAKKNWKKCFLYE